MKKIKRYVISGTDTGIGKTVFAAALVNALNAYYWKPIQSGITAETDSEVVMRLARAPKEHILPERWKLQAPFSPHYAAQLEKKVIPPDSLHLPEVCSPLVIEGAGGLLVPLNEDSVLADVFAEWQVPVILCARTTLGTINHTLLSIEAMRNRHIPIHGIAFIGDAVADTEHIIAKLGKVPLLGRLPWLHPLTPETLQSAFRKHFSLRYFTEEISA